MLWYLCGEVGKGGFVGGIDGLYEVKGGYVNKCVGDDVNEYVGKVW